MSTFYLDYENGNDATTSTPLGWWSVAFTNGNGTEPPADNTATGGTSGSTAKVTVVSTTSGTWAGGTAGGTIYWYGKSAAFVAETLTFTNGATCSIGGDFTYCAWKTITSGATAARIAPGDVIRIAKSSAPTSIGNGTWTTTTTTGGGFPATVSITSSTNASPIVITRASHGYSNGDIIQVVGHATNTAANGIWIVANVTANTLELQGSTGNGVGGATGTMQKVTSKVVQLATAQTATIVRCEANWTAIAGGDCTPTLVAVSTDAKEGGNCVRLTLDSAVQVSVGQAYFATGTLDLSTYQKITFWIKNSAAIVANNYQVKLCSDAAGATPVDSFDIPAIPSTNQWVPITITKTGGGNLGNSIASIAIYTSTVAPTNSSNILIDNFVACTTSGMSLQSLISKNSAEQGGSHGWYGVQSISQDGKLIALDNNVNNKSNAGRGYSGTTETVTTYIRETIKTAMASSSGTSVQAIQDSGNSTSRIEFLGGWSTSTNLQSGETFFDGLNGLGISIDSNSKDWIKLSYLSFCRYSNGLAPSANADGWLIDVLTNVSNNTSNGFQWASGSMTRNQINTISFANNNGGNGVNYQSNNFNATVGTITEANNNLGYGVDINYQPIDTVSNANNNTNGGIRFNGSNTTIKTVGNVKNNGTYGILFAGGAADNLVRNAICASNLSGSIGSNGTMYTNNYCYNVTMSDSTEVQTITDYYQGTISSGRHDATEYSKIFMSGGTAIQETNDRVGGSGYKWKLTTSSTSRTSFWPLAITLARFAVNSGSAVTFKCYVKKDHATNADAKLVLVGGQLAGLSSSNVTVTKANDTNWEELTINCGTPSTSGVIEVQGWQEYVTGHTNVYFADATITQA